MSAKANILVIDDEEVVRHCFSRVLRNEDCHVELAGDGTHGLRAMSRQPFDVVLLDLKMPGMDGVEVLGAIKQQWPQTEVVVITGYPTIDTAKQAIRLGAFDYLAKPVAPDEVLDAANGAMQHKRWALCRDAAA